MNSSGAIQLDRPLTADQMRPGLLSSVVADDELGDGRLRYRTQKLVGYTPKGQPIYQVKGSSRQNWSEMLAWQEADGPAVANSAARSSLLIPASSPLAGQSGRFTLPADYFDVGKALRVTAQGRISTFTSGTLLLDVGIGSAVVFSGGAVTLVVSLTNKTWEMTALLSCRSVGATTAATILGIGRLVSSAVVGSTGGAANSAMLPDSAPAVGGGFDSKVANVLDLFATWSVANAANSITLHNYALEALN